MPLTIDLILENEVFREWMEKGLKEGRRKGVLEGRKRGMQEGRKEGRQEGRKEGRQEGLQLGEATVLCRQLECRFGRLPAWAARRIEDADTKLLEKWALQLLEADKIQDVFT